MKGFWTIFLLASITISSVIPSFATIRKHQELTASEERESRDIAIQFSARFLETTDLSPLAQDLFLSDFIERYRSYKSKTMSSSPAADLYFVPGLEYNARLLTEASPEDWRRFYIAANNFLFFGVTSMVKNFSGSGESLSSTDLYPSSVIRLLNSNPNLAHMIVRKGTSKAVSSVEEMRKATATLEQAAAMRRKDLKGKAPLSLDRNELSIAMKEDEHFKPRLFVTNDEFFDFPQGTRIIFINTPLLFRLMLVSRDDKLRILGTDPYVVD